MRKNEIKNKIVKILTVCMCLISLVSALVIAPSAASVLDVGWGDLPDTPITDEFVAGCSSTLTYLPEEVYMGYSSVHCKDLTLNDLNRFIPALNPATSSTSKSRFIAFREFLGAYREIYGTDSVFQTYYYLGKGFFMFEGAHGDRYLYDNLPALSMFTDMNLYVDWKYRTDDSLLLTFRVRCKNANTSTTHYDTPFSEVNLIYQFIVNQDGAKCKKHWFSAQGDSLDYELILYLDDDLNGVPERMYGEKYYEGMPEQTTSFAFGLTTTSVRGASRTDLFACLYQTIFGANQEDFFFSFPKAYANGSDLGETVGYQQGYGEGIEVGYYIGYQDAEEAVYDVAYSDGYAIAWDDCYWPRFNEGYNEGYSNGNSVGYSEGQSVGYSVGYEDARKVYDNGSAWMNMKNLIFAIFDAPFYVISYSLNFDLFGINIAGTLIALISTALIAWILKIILVKLF